MSSNSSTSSLPRFALEKRMKFIFPKTILLFRIIKSLAYQSMRISVKLGVKAVISRKAAAFLIRP
jgi:hypothetical protein